jgi:hypothetical protein
MAAGQMAGDFIHPGIQQGALGAPLQADGETQGTSDRLVHLLMDAAVDVFDGSQDTSQGAGGTGDMTRAGGHTGHTPILVNVLPGGRGTQDLDGTQTFERGPAAMGAEGFTTASPTAASPVHNAPMMVHPVCLVYGQPCSLTIVVPVSSVLAALQRLQGAAGPQQQRHQGPLAAQELSVRVLLIQGDQVILDQAADGSIPGAHAAAALVASEGQGSIQPAGMQGSETRMLLIK